MTWAGPHLRHDGGGAAARGQAHEPAVELPDEQAAGQLHRERERIRQKRVSRDVDRDRARGAPSPESDGRRPGTRRGNVSDSRWTPRLRVVATRPRTVVSGPRADTDIAGRRPAPVADGCAPGRSDDGGARHGDGTDARTASPRGPGGRDEQGGDDANDEREPQQTSEN